jgi:hypothetical protein
MVSFRESFIISLLPVISLFFLVRSRNLLNFAELRVPILEELALRGVIRSLVGFIGLVLEKKIELKLFVNYFSHKFSNFVFAYWTKGRHSLFAKLNPLEKSTKFFFLPETKKMDNKAAGSKAVANP